MDQQPGSLDRASGSMTDPETDARTRILRAEIEETREDLSETVDAIQEKLRPGNLVAGAASVTKEKVKDMANTAAETAEEWWDTSGGQGFVDRVRNNPIPALLAGVGLTWLAMANGGHRRSSLSGLLSSPRRPDSSRSGASFAARSARAMGSADKSARSGSSLDSMIRDYPLAVGVAAAILGASLGMAVPETELENEWMGEARDNAWQRAQEAATGAVDRVKEAAADVVTQAAIGD
jgi:hypothetical protein